MAISEYWFKQNRKCGFVFPRIKLHPRLLITEAGTARDGRGRPWALLANLWEGCRKKRLMPSLAEKLTLAETLFLIRGN